MTYLAVFSTLFGVLFAWTVFSSVRKRQRNFRKQERLSSAFDRSQAMRTHGPGAQGISQNFLIANWGPSSPTIRRNLT